jgi:phytol kinase
MFIFSLVATFLALVVFAQPIVTSLALAFCVAIVATIVEAFSPFGIDNLTVPLTSAIVLVLLNGVIGK